MKRYYSCALLLTLIVGYSALSLHTTTHDTVELVKCELCVTQAGFANAVIPSGIELRLRITDSRVAPNPLVSVIILETKSAYHQRAPPVYA